MSKLVLPVQGDPRRQPYFPCSPTWGLWFSKDSFIVLEWVLAFPFPLLGVFFSLCPFTSSSRANLVHLLRRSAPWLPQPYSPLILVCVFSLLTLHALLKSHILFDKAVFPMMLSPSSALKVGLETSANPISSLNCLDGKFGLGIGIQNLLRFC